MPKYRILTLKELESMEKEFIDFLVLNGITGGDWEKLKVEKPESAEGICEAFSDVVFTKILKQCRYIESHTSKHLIAIFCDEKEMHLQGLEVPQDSSIDFTNTLQFKQLKTNPPKGIQKLKSHKPYSENREMEIWKMLNNGFFISDQKLYMTLFNL
ncbi:MAG: DUF6495 family protein [Bacteroidota bacterium]